MKKRLLALALCLVTMTSLLPLSAAAANVDRIHITGSGFGNTSTSPYNLQNGSCNVTVDGQPNTPGFIGYSLYLYQDVQCYMLVWNDLVDGETYYFGYGIKAPDTISFSQMSKNDCVLEVDGYSTACVKLEPDRYYPSYWQIIFQVTKHKHNWQFTQTDSTLTGTCGSCKKEVSVSLKADSVTLPNSPFKAAQLVGWKAFTDAIPSATHGIFNYKCDGVEVSDQSTPKAGKYQAFVKISNLPGPVMYEGDKEGQYGEADLYVHYTAVDPAVTAQTGDNRPIELMLGSVLVFSALAAAAFIADSKRKSQQ